MILAIDQGTTGTTCLVLDAAGAVRGRATREHPQAFPRPGWVEHDLDAIWDSVAAAAAGALDAAGVDGRRVRALGIANQRETVAAWSRDDTAALHTALVWQDRRTAARCDELREAGLEGLVRERTGLVIDPYFSATKLEWLLRELPDLRERARSGRAVLGTIDAWLVHRLTGEPATDHTNASRTMLYDLRAGCWDGELLERFGVPERALAPIRPSAGPLGRVRAGVLDGLDGVPVTGLAGDQQAALFGHGCVEAGLGKNTYGTGSFVLLGTGEELPVAPEGLLATVAWQLGERREFALEAAILVAGAAVQWLRDGLGIIATAAESEPLAASLATNDDVYFVPALAGLGSPHWDPYARGTLVGLTGGCGRAHVARATLEAIAYQVVDAVRAMEAGAAPPLRELRADGGASVNRWLMQFQADVLGVPVVASEVPEVTALGAARLAGVGAGLMTLDDVAHAGRAGRRFEPCMPAPERDALLARWREAVGRARGWAAL